MSTPFNAVRQPFRGPQSRPRARKLGRFELTEKSVFVGVIMGTLLLTSILVGTAIDLQLGKGIFFIAVIFLCISYPSAILWSYLVFFATPQVTAAQAQLAQGTLLFVGLMVGTIVMRTGLKREIKVPRTCWIAYGIYLAVILKGVALPSIYTTTPSADVESVLLLALAFLLIRTEDDRKLLSNGFVTASVILSVWTVYRMTRGQAPVSSIHVGTIEYRGNLAGDLFDPNQVSEYIGFGLMLSLAALLQVKGRQKWIAYAPLVGHVVVSMWALGLLASRGTGPLAIVAAAALMMTIHYRQPFKSLASLGVLAVIALLAAQLPAFALVIDRWTNTKEVATGAGRTLLWTLGLNHVFSSDSSALLFGEGGGATYGIVSTIMHNQFLQALIEYGMIGLTSLVVLLSSAGRAAFNLASRTRTADVGLFIYLIIVCFSLVPLSKGWGSWGWLALALVATANPSKSPLPEKEQLNGEQ